MFNEATLHKYPALIGAFTGIPAEEFWDMLDKMEAKLPAMKWEGTLEMIENERLVLDVSLTRHSR